VVVPAKSNAEAQKHSSSVRGGIFGCCFGGNTAAPPDPGPMLGR